LERKRGIKSKGKKSLLSGRKRGGKIERERSEHRSGGGICAFIDFPELAD